MPSVFVVNDSGHYMADAERYGNLIHMTVGLVDKFAVTTMHRTFRTCMRHSTPEDYILVSGPTVMCSVACAVFAAMHGRLNLLLWKFEKDGKDRYVHHKLCLNKE